MLCYASFPANQIFLLIIVFFLMSAFSAFTVSTGSFCWIAFSIFSADCHIKNKLTFWSATGRSRWDSRRQAVRRECVEARPIELIRAREFCLGEKRKLSGAYKRNRICWCFYVRWFFCFFKNEVPRRLVELIKACSVEERCTKSLATFLRLPESLFSIKFSVFFFFV